MKKIGFGAGITLTLLYLYAMIAHPLFTGGWGATLSTWREWQTFNAGMIALLAATITATTAVYVDRQTRKRQTNRLLEERRRNFIAARAFLPHALANIDEYALACAVSLRKVYLAGGMNGLDEDGSYIDIDVELLPNMYSEFQSHPKPKDFESVFQNAIQYAEDEDARHLADLLAELQIFLSRMSDIEKQAYQGGDKHLLEMFVYSAYFQLKIAGFYNFARKGDPIQLTPNKAGDYYHRLTTLGDDHAVIREGDLPQLDDSIRYYCR